MRDAPVPPAPTRPAVVLLAHGNPVHLRRLVHALDPFPVLLHVDANTPEDTHRAMTHDLPDRVLLLPRLAAGWAHHNVLVAELDGYRAGLEHTDATHFLLLTGADYPLADVATVRAALAAHPDTSILDCNALPHAPWGRLGGYDRFIFPHRVVDRRRVWTPIPRRVPFGLRAAGGSQMKVMTRAHAQHLIDVWDAEPRLDRFFSTCWVPDEVVIPTLFNTPRFGFAEHGDVLTGQHPWYIDWGATPSASPRWLGPEDLPALRAACLREGLPALFARKFNDASGPVLDRIDSELRVMA